MFLKPARVRTFNVATLVYIVIRDELVSVPDDGSDPDCSIITDTLIGRFRVFCQKDGIAAVTSIKTQWFNQDLETEMFGNTLGGFYTPEDAAKIQAWLVEQKAACDSKLAAPDKVYIK